MRPNDDEYLYARAETQLELAQKAAHPKVVKAHYLLANHYLDRLYGAGVEAEEAAAEPAVTA